MTGGGPAPPPVADPSVALISSKTINPQREERTMSEQDQKTASEDIVVENANGQQVVVVHEGQPIPDNLDELKAQAGAVSGSATDEEVEEARGVETTSSRRRKSSG
jgi:hypothetical protein